MAPEHSNPWTNIPYLLPAPAPLTRFINKHGTGSPFLGGCGKKRTGTIFRLRRRQSALEYAVLIAVVAAALLAMQVYMKRGFSGGWRNASDSLGEQYEPKNTTSKLTTTVTGTSVTKSELLLQQDFKDSNGVAKKANMIQTTTTIDANDPETTSRTGNETVGPIGTNLWK